MRACAIGEPVVYLVICTDYPRELPLSLDSETGLTGERGNRALKVHLSIFGSCLQSVVDSPLNGGNVDGVNASYANDG